MCVLISPGRRGFDNTERYYSTATIRGPVVGEPDVMRVMRKMRETERERERCKYEIR